MNAQEKSLIGAWALLMGLSIALAFAAEAARPQHYLFAWSILVAAVAFWKARIVLSAYLGLRAARGALGGFSLAVAFILALVVASLAVQAFVARFA